MNGIQIGDIVHPARTLALDDSLRRAVDLLADSPSEAVAVTDNGRVMGLVTSRSVASAVSPGGMPDGKALPVSYGMILGPVVVDSAMPLVVAAETLRSTGAPALVVADANGAYRGLVGRTELMGALWGMLKLPSIAGMATPLGVHLTTGSLRAGPGNIGLFLTGTMLGLITFVAGLLANLTAIGLWHTRIPALQSLVTTQGGDWGLPEMTLWLHGALQVFLFLMLVRLSPLSGYHAAEHQVVHAIEQSEDLVPEKVRLMPRPHPRCGTNLMVVVGLGYTTLLLSSALGAWGDAIMIPVIIFLLFGWRKIGWMVQQHFTTRPASPRQMESGIRAGKALIEAYRACPGRPAGVFGRIWNAGFPQVMLGLSTIAGINQLLMYVLHR